MGIGEGHQKAATSLGLSPGCSSFLGCCSGKPKGRQSIFRGSTCQEVARKRSRKLQRRHGRVPHAALVSENRGGCARLQSQELGCLSRRVYGSKGASPAISFCPIPTQLQPSVFLFWRVSTIKPPHGQRRGIPALCTHCISPVLVFAESVLDGGWCKLDPLKLFQARSLYVQLHELIIRLLRFKDSRGHFPILSRDPSFQKTMEEQLVFEKT